MSMFFELLLKKLAVPDPECPNTQDCLELACSECGTKYCVTHKDVEGIYCPGCGERVCGNCTVMCEDCNSIYCPNCVQVCDGCGWTICKMICVDNHQHGEEPVCPGDGCELRNCDTCGTEYCFTHSIPHNCSQCANNLCSDCAIYCEKCTFYFCPICDEHNHGCRTEDDPWICKVCGGELWTCGCCGDEYCWQHEQESKTCDCGLVVCEDCVATCDDCRRVYCTVCGECDDCGNRHCPNCGCASI